VSATLQDVIRRFKKKKRSWNDFPTKTAIQLNDTHPSLGIVELLRILIDTEGLDHPEAWEVVYKTFSYTNHTVLPEALEKWGVDLITRLLPRHMEIIYHVNKIFLDKVAAKYVGDFGKMNSMSIIEEGPYKKVRMANLSVIGSHMVNGVAAIHSELVKGMFADFYQMRPKKFINKTNGVTPRRWLKACNRELSDFYDRLLGTDEWILDMSMLKKLEDKAEDPAILSEFMEIKRKKKLRLVSWVREHCNIEVNPDSVFDIQVKRIHEYKRQFMNIIYVVYRYLLLKELP
jgi:starch phosphorylase